MWPQQTVLHKTSGCAHSKVFSLLRTKHSFPCQAAMEEQQLGQTEATTLSAVEVVDDV